MTCELNLTLTRITSAGLLLMLCLGIGADPARAGDPFAGRFVAHHAGERIELELEIVAAGGYEGVLRRDGETLLLQARRFGDRLVGRIGDETGGIAILVEARGMGISIRLDDGVPLFLRRR